MYYFVHASGGKGLEIYTAGLEFESGHALLVRALDSFTHSPGPTKYAFRGVEFPWIQKKISPKIKYILLKHEYHNNYSNTKIQQLKRQTCIPIRFISPFLFPLEPFLIKLLKTISSSIFNFHSRFYTINYNYFRLIYCRYQFHWYHYHPVGVDAWRSVYLVIRSRHGQIHNLI
jgi:hypothetical protein